jgi:hypothetical protein
MTARLMSLALSILVVIPSACAGADGGSAAGEWSGDLAITGSSGSPPASIGGSYSVSATVESKDESTCGVTVSVAEVGTWTRADGVACEDGGFDVALGADENTELTLDDVESVKLEATSDNKLTLVLGGSAPDWTCTFAGDGTHAE